MSETLPACIASNANEDGSVRRGDGFVFPPYLIMDRGTPLAQWKQTPRQVLAVVSMLQEVLPSPPTTRNLFLTPRQVLAVVGMLQEVPPSTGRSTAVGRCCCSVLPSACFAVASMLQGVPPLPPILFFFSCFAVSVLLSPRTELSVHLTECAMTPRPCAGGHAAAHAARVRQRALSL